MAGAGPVSLHSSIAEGAPLSVEDIHRGMASVAAGVQAIVDGFEREMLALGEAFGPVREMEQR